MKKITAFLIAAYVFAACADLDEVSVQESFNDIAHVLETVEPDPDTTNVNQFEIQRVLNYLNRNDDNPGSRYAVTYETSTICDSEGNEALYIVNYPENGGFYIISARKEGCPVLAFSTEGNFNVSDFKESDLLTWIETSAHQVTHMQVISPDSVKLNRRRWAQFEKTMNSSINCVASRSLDANELHDLTGIMMDKSCEWMMQPEIEYYDYQTFRIRHPDKAAYYDEVLPGGMIYMPYYEDYEQLTLFVEYTKTTEYGDVNSQNITWEQGNGYNELFPCGDRVDYVNHTVYYGPWDAGCVTIAAGQLMRLNKYPPSLPWDSMPLHKASHETAVFLYDLASVSNPKYESDGATGIDMAVMTQTLKNYGYSATYVLGFDESNLDIPSIIYSTYNGADGRHAFLVSGSYSWSNEKVVEVWTFNAANTFNKVDSFNSSQFTEYSPVYHYVNWGWGEGKGNGWYYNISNIAPPNVTGEKKISLISGIRPNV